MIISTFIAKKIIGHCVKKAMLGESLGNGEIKALMTSVDSLGDADGKCELSDVIDIIKDQFEDVGDLISDIWDFLT